MSHIRADFDGLLELAEKLQKSSQEFRYRYEQATILQEGLRLLLLIELAAGCVIGIAWLSPHIAFFGRLFDPNPFAIALGIGDVVFGLFTIRYFFSVLHQSRQLKQTIRSDERDLSEVVELLREIEPVYAKEEKLSALERVQIRIRLSRFGIGSSSRGSAEGVGREQNGESRTHKSRIDQELMKPF